MTSVSFPTPVHWQRGCCWTNLFSGLASAWSIKSRLQHINHPARFLLLCLDSDRFGFVWDCNPLASPFPSKRGTAAGPWKCIPTGEACSSLPTAATTTYSWGSRNKSQVPIAFTLSLHLYKPNLYTGPNHCPAHLYETQGQQLRSHLLKCHSLLLP